MRMCMCVMHLLIKLGDQNIVITALFELDLKMAESISKFMEELFTAKETANKLREMQKDIITREYELIRIVRDRVMYLETENRKHIEARNELEMKLSSFEKEMNDIVDHDSNLIKCGVPYCPEWEFLSGEGMYSCDKCDKLFCEKHLQTCAIYVDGRYFCVKNCCDFKS